MFEISAEKLTQMCDDLLNSYCNIDLMYVKKDKLISDMIPLINNLIEAHNLGKFSDPEDGYRREDEHFRMFREMAHDIGMYNIFDRVADKITRDIWRFFRACGMEVD